MIAKVVAWKARSQAANHGYSHASGMESTSLAYRWAQSASGCLSP